MIWEAHCAEYLWEKESIETCCTCRSGIHVTAISLKTDLNTLQTIYMYLSLYHTVQVLTILRKMPLENFMGKGENAGDQTFLFSY